MDIAASHYLNYDVGGSRVKFLSICKGLIVFNAFALSSYASAGISVYPIEVNLGSSGNTKIEVMSQSDKVSFVKITEKKIINAGTPQEKEVAVDGVDDGGLIITPLKLAITPGSSRIVRMVTLNPPEKETTWRVYIQEVSAEEFNSADDNKPQSKASAEVGVNIVWGALVHVLPRQTVFSLGFSPKSGLVFNNGTSRIKIKEIGECSSGGGCVWKASGASVYPDTHVKIFPFKYKPGSSYKVRFLGIPNGEKKEIPLNLING
ncbi:fimbrial protein [Pantoea sp. Ap-870]|uniref:fimbrial protein n=1 Tax=unclassified Pantoea TaxID=2630326 RepID=UPI0011B0A9B9|nr:MULTISPECIES: fimbrial protein [unclassified Pantoea]NIE54784.1 fimbrial protein [Pantoea sp. Ap-870]NIG36799.1 fimbrial protein [Pantoea sp. Ap-959]